MICRATDIQNDVANIFFLNVERTTTARNLKIWTEHDAHLGCHLLPAVFTRHCTGGRRSQKTIFLTRSFSIRKRLCPFGVRHSNSMVNPTAASSFYNSMLLWFLRVADFSLFSNCTTTTTFCFLWSIFFCQARALPLRRGSWNGDVTVCWNKRSFFNLLHLNCFAEPLTRNTY